MKLLDGKILAAQIRAEVKEEIQNQNLKIGLAAILVGEDPASHLYVSLKQKACLEVGIDFHSYKFPTNETVKNIKTTIDFLNQDPETQGMIIQLPLPAHLNEDELIARMDPHKDADGFHPENLKLLKNGNPRIIPGLTAGIWRFLESTNLPLAGKTAAIVSNSPIFAEPVEIVLKNHGIISQILNPSDADTKTKLKNADIIIIAIGQANWLKGADIKKDAILIDVGINKQKGGTVVGDIDTESVKNKAAFLTPVPGGIGPVTVAMLLKNTVELAKHGA